MWLRSFRIDRNVSFNTDKIRKNRIENKMKVKKINAVLNNKLFLA